MKVPAQYFYVIVVSICGLMAAPAEGQSVPEQTISYDFRGESLEHVLDAIARDTGIDLVYDPELVRGERVFKRLENREVTEALRLILFDLDLDYITLSSGTVVIIRRAEDAPAFGTLSGIIVDSRTGEPLPGATVMFADAAGGTSTGQMGQFSINRIISGDHTLIFSFVGYSAVTKRITIPPGRNIHETIEMRPRPVDVAPVIVESHRPQMFGLGESGETVNFRPGSYDWSSDPVQNLAMIPGVNSGVPMSDISLQGGHESEHRVMLDGVPVYSPHTIGRLLSSFSPYAIGSVEVQRAGYGVRRGSQIAGLINMSHDLPVKDQKEIMLQADPVNINLRGDLSYSLKDQSSVSVMSAFRTNIWSVYRDPMLEETLRDWDVIDPLITNSLADLDGNAAYFEPYNHQAELSFHDFHTAIRYKPNMYHAVQLSIYDSDNSLGTAVLNRALPGRDEEPYLYAAETYSWNNRMVQLSWNSLPTPRLGIDSQVSYTRSSFGHSSELGFGIPSQFRANVESSFSSDAGGIRLDQIELPSEVKGNEIEHFIMKSDASFSLSPTIELMGGLQFDRVSSALDSGEEVSLLPLSDVTSSMLSGYSSGSFRFGRYWHLNAGSRFTYLDETGRVYAEPRMSLQIDRPESGIGYWSAKISGGLYRQFINEYRVSNIGATSVVPSFSIWTHAGTLPIPKAYHLTGSWHLEPSDNSTLRIEGYLKWQPVTSITSYRPSAGGNESEGQVSVDVFAETTEMRASGMGIRYERALFDSKLKLLAGYDYSYATIDMESQFSQSVSTPWNDPHRGQLRAVWDIIDDLTLIGKWQGIWGRAWAFRDSYYNYLQMQQQSLYGFDFSSPGDDHLPHFSQLDLSVLYRPEIGSANLLLQLDFINILNRRNVMDHRLSPVFNESVVSGYDIAKRSMPGFYPKFSLKVSL